MEMKQLEFKGARFTLRQMQVISLLAHGLTHQQAAAYLCCTEGTVKSHLKMVRTALHIDNCRMLVALALEDGFDRKGHFRGIDLFEGFQGDLPWRPVSPKER
jgi:DNA-binding NarL/FixJ family response regulator